MDAGLFINEYSALFYRFVNHISSLKYDSCLTSYDGKKYQFQLQGFFSRYSGFAEELQSWDEWIALNTKVLENGGIKLNYFFIVQHQFSEILNELEHVESHLVPTFNHQVPHLGYVLSDLPLLNKTLIHGEMSFPTRDVTGYVVLIHGLKVTERIDIDGIGYFDLLDDNVKKFSGFKYGLVNRNHLCTGFFTHDINYTLDNFIIKLMTSIRTFKKGDVKYSLILSKSKGITYQDVYEREELNASNRFYTEQTDLFSSRSTMLIEVTAPEIDSFKKHVSMMIDGLQHMISCCEYYNYASIAPQKMLLPFSFISFEACFPSSSNKKSEQLARKSAIILEEGALFKATIIELYRLRNSITHNNSGLRQRVLNKIIQDNLPISKDGREIIDIIGHLLIKLASKRWNPQIDGKNI